MIGRIEFNNFHAISQEFNQLHAKVDRLQQVVSRLADIVGDLEKRVWSVTPAPGGASKDREGKCRTK